MLRVSVSGSTPGKGQKSPSAESPHRGLRSTAALIFAAGESVDCWLADTKNMEKGTEFGTPAQQEP
jgi:hypothetical protein